MVERARRNYPDIPFEIQDLRSLPYQAEFDAVFSNAALHWVQPAGDAAASIARALKPGGRFVAEFGARGQCSGAAGSFLAGRGNDGPGLAAACIRGSTPA